MFLRTKRTKTKKISVKVGKLKKETLVLLSKPIEENNSFLQFLRNNPNDFKFSKSDLLDLYSTDSAKEMEWKNWRDSLKKLNKQYND